MDRFYRVLSSQDMHRICEIYMSVPTIKSSNYLHAYDTILEQWYFYASGGFHMSLFSKMFEKMNNAIAGHQFHWPSQHVHDYVH